MGVSPIESGLREVRNNHVATATKLKTLKRVGGVLTLALVVVILGFIGALYSKASAMYAPEKFEQPLLEEMQGLVPKFEPQLRTLWAETAPVYGNLAKQRFEETLPVVQEATRREFDLLVDNIVRDTGDRLDRAIERIHKKQMQRMAQQFPRLSDERMAEELGWSWMETIQKDFERPLLHFHEKYVEDLGELVAALDQFSPNQFEEMEQDELMRQFAHLWLQKADRWVLLTEDGKPFEGADHVN